MSQGFSYETFAAVIDVDRSTIYEWEKHHVEFSDAKKRAFDKCQLQWEKIGIGLALGQEKFRYGSTGSWAFNMKNRFGWTDKQEFTTKEGSAFQLSYSTDRKPDGN